MICNNCNIDKNVSEFYKSKSDKTGYQRHCKLCQKDRLKQWSIDNRDKKNLKQKNYVERNKEVVYSRNRKYQQDNKEKYSLRKKQYYNDNKHLILQNLKNKRATDICYKLSRNISSSMSTSLKGNKAGRYWETLVDYNLNDLKQHLEKQFDTEMNWDNYGSYWHIDHIIPKSWFNYSSNDDDEFKECWKLENLQPLKASDNFSKCNRYSGKPEIEKGCG
jgi:hypothetical protein